MSTYKDRVRSHATQYMNQGSSSPAERQYLRAFLRWLDGLYGEGTYLTVGEAQMVEYRATWGEVDLTTILEASIEKVRKEKALA